MSVCGPVARKECIDRLQFQGQGVFTCSFFNTVTNECEKLNEREEIDVEIKRLSKVYEYYTDQIDVTKKQRNGIEKELTDLKIRRENL